MSNHLRELEEIVLSIEPPLLMMSFQQPVIPGSRDSLLVRAPD